MMMDGGIRIPSVPAPASEPIGTLLVVARLRSSGSATLAIVAQVAAGRARHRPEDPAAEDVHVHAAGPGCQFSHGARPSNICSESRVRNRISPIQMKSGSAASVHDALEPHKAVKRLRTRRGAW